MTRILGIDPGSRSTGYGIIQCSGQRTAHVASGCIRVQGNNLAARLKVIFDGITELVGTHQPCELVVEQVFMHRNAASALKLGHARGAVLLAGVMQALPVYEYTPAQVKQATTCKGNATKEQVQHMVKVLLCLRHLPQSDAADALAVALCHGHTRETLDRMTRQGATVGAAYP